MELSAQIQEETIMQERFLDRRFSLSFGGHIHERGLGLDMVYAKQASKLWETTYSVSLASLKDRKETKIDSRYKDNGGSAYIFDKINYVYTLTFLYGKQKTHFHIDKYNRLSFRSNISIGPSFALLKPYLLEVIDTSFAGRAVIVVKPYDHRDFKTGFDNVVGEAAYFSNLGRISAVPGVSLKYTAFFNFAGSTLFIRAVQLGLKADWFVKPIEIMDRGADKQLFVNAYLGVLIGNAWN